MMKAALDKIAELAAEHAWKTVALPAIPIIIGFATDTLSGIGDFYTGSIASAIVLTATLLLLGIAIGINAVGMALSASSTAAEREKEELDRHNLAQIKGMPIELKELVYRAYTDGSVEVGPRERAKYLSADQIFDMETIMPPKTSLDYRRPASSGYERWTLNEYARELLSDHEEVFDVFR